MPSPSGDTIQLAGGAAKAGADLHLSKIKVFAKKLPLAVGTRIDIQHQEKEWFKVTVSDGEHAGKSGWLLDGTFTRDDDQAPAAVASQQNAYKALAEGEAGRKRKGDVIDARISSVSEGEKVSHLEAFGGSSTRITVPESNENFSTPPGSPRAHENENRTLVRPEDVDETDLIFNLSLNFDEKRGLGYEGVKIFGKDYSQGKSKNVSSSNNNNNARDDIDHFKAVDRKHMRISALLTNESAAMSDSKLLKATPLNEDEERSKQRYLATARSKHPHKRKGDTNMHEPDQQFLEPESEARKKGGSQMGFHVGPSNANSAMGQVLHPDHPDEKKTRKGIGRFLVQEKDGNHYLYRNAEASAISKRAKPNSSSSSSTTTTSTYKAMQDVDSDDEPLLDQETFDRIENNRELAIAAASSSTVTIPTAASATLPPTLLTQSREEEDYDSDDEALLDQEILEIIARDRKVAMTSTSSTASHPANDDDSGNEDLM